MQVSMAISTATTTMSEPRPPPPPRGSTKSPLPQRPPPPPPIMARPAPPPHPKRPHESIRSLPSSSTQDHLSKAPKTSESQINFEYQTFGVHIRKPVVLRDLNVFQTKKQVGAGTYGKVFMGVDKDSGDIVALKKINTKQEENGFPITALREVKILKALHHDNIVKLKEIVSSKGQNESPEDVFMVFEYHEYDLTGILESTEIRFTQDHIKSWSHQLLTGVHYMHVNKIIHRDLKAANILINRRGQLRIADWGLARSLSDRKKQLTNGVVTLWYRPIELLLGCKAYDSKIDMWSVGCIIAEMFRRYNLLKGQTEAEQLNLIFHALGHPGEDDWPSIHDVCPLWKNYEPKPEERLPNRLRQALKLKNRNPANWLTDNAVHLLEKLLTFNPEKRWCALDAVTSAYFFEKPSLKEPKDLNMKFVLDSVHEWEVRKKHELTVASGSTQHIPSN